MFELIIIISLALIFFIFLIRMPEVEKIRRQEEEKSPWFRFDFKGMLNNLKKVRIKTIRSLARPSSIESKTQKQDTDEETKDLSFEAERKLKFGDLDGAEKLYLRLAVVSPHDASIYSALGKIYLERQNFNDAIASFKAAINRDRKNGFYYYDLAAALFKAERYKEAVTCFEKSILINNRIPSRHFGLGLSLMRMGENEKAVAAFRRAYEIEPNNQKYKKLLKKTESKLSSPTLS